MTRRAAFASTALVFLWCGSAHAHGTIQSLGAFYTGLLHPFLAPAHVLAMAGTGLLLGQARDTEVGGNYLIFLAAYGVALCFTLAGVGWSASPVSVIGVAAGLGILVAAALPVPALVAGLLVLVAGAVLGLDSGADGASLGANLLLTLGTFISGAVAVMAATVLSRSASARWHRIGVRVLGSWIAAASLMVLALALSRIRAA